ncbi:hypothetical protein ACLOJK_009636 [Asimina triloba]
MGPGKKHHFKQLDPAPRNRQRNSIRLRDDFPFFIYGSLLSSSVAYHRSSSVAYHHSSSAPTIFLDAQNDSFGKENKREQEEDVVVYLLLPSRGNPKRSAQCDTIQPRDDANPSMPARKKHRFLVGWSPQLQIHQRYRLFRGEEEEEEEDDDDDDDDDVRIIFPSLRRRIPMAVF